MRQIVAAILLTAWAGLSQQAAGQATQSDIPSPAQNASGNQKAAIIVPAGTKVALALTSPIWARSAKVGDSIHSATSFPVAVGNEMAIPPGTYVEGTIDALKRPGWFSNHAEFQFHFIKLVFANGYTVELPEVVEDRGDSANPPASSHAMVSQLAAGTSATQASTLYVEAAVARVYVEVTPRNDVLLDNGAPIEMLLQSPISLDAGSVAAAVSRSKPLQFTATKSSTRCVPTPGTPGTSDTVIPGSPGTPDTVIPGAPGMPPTVIPGSPATPATVIPGTPGTAGTVCPGPPLVISVPIGKDVHTKMISVTSAMLAGGARLVAGKYQVRWTGLGPTAQVEIVLNKKQVVQMRARVVILGIRPATDEVVPRTNADGTISLGSLQFAGETFALFFD
jgi:type IV secretion system protein VirB10